MNREAIQNKEDFIIYILEQLHLKVHPVAFGAFFMEISPAGGIDSFRNLLDDLHQNGLVTKQENPGAPSPVLPHLRTVDLRYGISVKGIQFLKQQQATVVNQKAMKEVFVTYSWDSEEHNDKVIAFTNELRDQGFDAEMDRFYSQQESAADFGKMMHQAMTDYKKVIVVLSKGYKEKAEAFRGGVGNEYNLILKDIQKEKQKYILVSFDGIHDEAIPLSFKDQEIIDLSDRKNLTVLYAKLMDKPLVQFSEVGKVKPVIEPKVVAPFRAEKVENLTIGRLRCHAGNASQFGQLYKMIEFVCRQKKVDQVNVIVREDFCC
ncbi:MAG TPA: SEFIR domain-containing protein [Flavisolibacter sp.]|nr:SEFIR domain-containing protein [Flavisolibacter sp.]